METNQASGCTTRNTVNTNQIYPHLKYLKGWIKKSTTMSSQVRHMMSNRDLIISRELSQESRTDRKILVCLLRLVAQISNHREEEKLIVKIRVNIIELISQE
jgi:hypothetical protein